MLLNFLLNLCCPFISCLYLYFIKAHLYSSVPLFLLIFGQKVRFHPPKSSDENANSWGNLSTSLLLSSLIIGFITLILLSLNFHDVIVLVDDFLFIIVECGCYYVMLTEEVKVIWNFLCFSQQKWSKMLNLGAQVRKKNSSKTIAIIFFTPYNFLLPSAGFLIHVSFWV